MSRADALARAGIQNVRVVSEHTTVIEFVHGGVRPATPTELNLLRILLSLTSSG